MSTSRAILTVAALAVTIAAPVQAAELLTPILRNKDGVHACTAMNKSTTGKITVKIQIIHPDSDITTTTCGPRPIKPQEGLGCRANDAGLGNAAYCKITTNNALVTRGSLMVLGSDLGAKSVVEAE